MGIKFLKEESDSAFCMLLGSTLKSAEPEYLKVLFARLMTLGRCKSVFHIATYTNTYNAAMHNSNNTVIITQFLSWSLTHDWQS